MTKHLLHPIASKPVLPNGVTIYRKSGQDAITTIHDFTLIPGQKGFEPVANVQEPGGDVLLGLFLTNAEAQAYRAGFSATGPDDDIHYTTERVKVGGRHIFAFVALFTDSADDVLRVESYL